MAIDLKRRDFLKIGAGVGLSALVGNVACGPDGANEDVCDLPLPTEAEMAAGAVQKGDRKSTRLNSSHVAISYAVFCLTKKSTKRKKTRIHTRCSTQND